MKVYVEKNDHTIAFTADGHHILAFCCASYAVNAEEALDEAFSAVQQGMEINLGRLHDSHKEDPSGWKQRIGAQIESLVNLYQGVMFIHSHPKYFTDNVHLDKTMDFRSPCYVERVQLKAECNTAKADITMSVIYGRDANDQVKEMIAQRFQEYCNKVESVTTMPGMVFHPPAHFIEDEFKGIDNHNTYSTEELATKLWQKTGISKAKWLQVLRDYEPLSRGMIKALAKLFGSSEEVWEGIQEKWLEYSREHHIQLQNPKTKGYTLLDTNVGRVLGGKKTPWPGVPIKSPRQRPTKKTVCTPTRKGEKHESQ